MIPDLSIILLVWRDAHFLPACLESIYTARGELALEIIIVTNGVTLDVSRSTERYGERSLLIHNPTNRGVAPARNQGLAAARGRYLMLLDVDTLVAPDSLVKLVEFMDAHPEVGLAAPRLEDMEGNLWLTCGRLPTLRSKFLRVIPMRWAQAALAAELLTHWDHRTPRAVDYCIGACQIIRREAYAEVGRLDEQFFYGPEDVDYCLRMWQRGWQVMYAPHACITHYGQRLTRRRIFSKLTWVHLIGLARYFVKHRYWWSPPRVQNGSKPAHNVRTEV